MCFDKMNNVLHLRVSQYAAFLFGVFLVSILALTYLNYGHYLKGKGQGHSRDEIRGNNTDDTKVYHQNADGKVVESFTKYTLSPDLVNKGLQAVDALVEVAKKANVSFFICCGTLLGSYRHHQMIPWDMDFDILVARKDRHKILKGLLAYKVLGMETNTNWTKLYHKDGWKTSVPWTFPVIDIFWTDENETHIWLKTENLYHTKAAIFPLSNRPFHGRMLPAPRDPRRALEEIYHKHNYLSPYISYGPLDNCQPNSYDNLRDEMKPIQDQVNIPCAQLVDYFPFVRHIRGPAGSYCREELEVKGKVVGSFTRSARNIPHC